MKPFGKILYGGDYNPEQWPREVWEQDMVYFKDAHLNSATVNVFSWARLQPAEDRYDFSELDAIIKMLSREGFDIVLATSTAALPAWMVRKYPEVARTDFEGRRHKFGHRHNACPNSPIFQKFSKALAGKLAKRYAENPHVTCWHVSNEYGGECYCEHCEAAFRIWLRKKYGTIEALNKAWNYTFWGHTVYDWEEIVLPNALSETCFTGAVLDYRRFMSDSMLENFKAERDAIRVYDKDTPITTNLMGTYKNLDYFKWAKEMDIVSWDNYPSLTTPWSLTAMRHDLMRGLKNAPFMLMEQTPSQQNWQAYNPLKKPGQMRAQSYQTVAHGADTIQFFQLRRSVGAQEKYHGAVIAHVGHNNTRVFREVKQLGAELERLGTSTLGSENKSDVGIVFDWDNYWALEETNGQGPTVGLSYVDLVHGYYKYFYDRNIGVDMIPFDGDFSKYKVVIAPVLYMVKEKMKEALTEYVKNGGVFLTTFMSGLADQSDNVHLGGYPGPFRELAGVWVEEIDALAPGMTNAVAFSDGSTATCKLLCDVMHLEGAEALAHYTTDFYAGTPVVTRNRFGNGTVYYVGTDFCDDGLDKVLDSVVADAGVSSVIDEETALEITCRESETHTYYFVMNFKDCEIELPSCFGGKKDLLTDSVIERGTKLKPYDTFLFVR